RSAFFLRAGRAVARPHRASLARRAHELHTPVDLAVRVLRVLELVLAAPDRLQGLAVDRVGADEMFDDRLRALFGKLLVEIRRAARIGVAFDDDLARRELAVARGERFAEALQLSFRFGREL